MAVLALGLGGLMAAAAFAQAQQTRLDGKVRAGDEVIVAADETVAGDLYATGGRVRIEGTVEGDLVAAGGQIDVLGEIGGDALLAGGSVTVSGNVAGDVRVGAGQFQLSGTAGEDVLIGSGQATVSSDATVGEDLIFTAGQVSVDGTVEGDVLGQAGSYSEAGTVGGTVDVTVGEPEAPPTAAERAAGALRRYASLLVVGALLLLAPRLLREGADSLRREPLKDLGVGALGLFGAIAASVIILIASILLAILFGLLQLGGLAGATIIGALLLIALIAFALVIAWAFLAPAVVGLWLGRFAIGGGWWRDFAALALGVLILVVLKAIPVVGAIVGFVVVLLGLGALLLATVRNRRGTPGPGQAPPEPVAGHRAA